MSLSSLYDANKISFEDKDNHNPFQSPRAIPSHTIDFSQTSYNNLQCHSNTMNTNNNPFGPTNNNTYMVQLNNTNTNNNNHPFGVDETNFNHTSSANNQCFYPQFASTTGPHSLYLYLYISSS